MASLTDYFERRGYRAEYEIGDRVCGRYMDIPFVGTVGNDRLISEERGPEVTIHLDLPVRVDGEVKWFIVVKHSDILPFR